jgi:glycosyltransferase involved in cell wall biosynthesis
MGFAPVLIGRLLPESHHIEREYSTHRMKLWFRKGPMFYLEFNLRLFFYLLKSDFDVLVANDLDTLPANYFVSKLKHKPLVYDSHEYFTEVPELIGRPLVKKIWTKIERIMVPKVDAAYTVCNSIARVYHEMYGVDFKVVRNLPVCIGIQDQQLRKNISSGSTKIIIYQGALNIGRGIELLIETMQLIEGAEFWIAGHGDITNNLKQMVEEKGLQGKVKFLGRLPFQEIRLITRHASLGISMEDDLGLNYRFALPNKLFDYIQARVPVLVSDLPEMRSIVDQYQIGEIACSRDRIQLAKQIVEMLFDEEKNSFWKKNLDIAASELCWEKEETILQAIFSRFLGEK